jgi:hypothetical protein
MPFSSTPDQQTTVARAFQARVGGPERAAPRTTIPVAQAFRPAVIAVAQAVTPALFAIVALIAGSPAHAQSVSRFSVESAVGVDSFGGENVNSQPQIVIDISAAMRVGDHWQIFVRPWLRLPRPAPTAATPPWDTQLYQAGLRYERSGSISTRIDAGYIVSPIGLGLFDARPNLNPTIASHLSYFVPMPVFDPTVPLERPVASTYPLGAVLMLSTDRWDARAAVVNSAPTRPYVVGARTRPRQTPVFEAGAGVTPMIGLRFGIAMAHGKYATQQEMTRPIADGRTMTMVSGEGEYSFRYTKINGEILRTSFETLAQASIAYESFVQVHQTLAPRWFVAARGERASAPPLINGIAVGTRTSLSIAETTVGYRVNPDVTLRTSYYARKPYPAKAWDNQFGVSVVWARRWW